MNDINDLMATMVDKTIPGGCHTCNAHQTVWEDPQLPGIWRITVAHDDDCPTLANIRNNTSQ